MYIQYFLSNTPPKILYMGWLNQRTAEHPRHSGDVAVTYRQAASCTIFALACLRILACLAALRAAALARFCRNAAACWAISLRSLCVSNRFFFCFGGAVPSRRLRRHAFFIAALRVGSAFVLTRFCFAGFPLRRVSHDRAIASDRSLRVSRSVPRAVHFLGLATQCLHSPLLVWQTGIDLDQTTVTALTP